VHALAGAGFSVPLIRDELRFSVAQRHDAEHHEGHPDNPQHPSQEALPMRRLDRFCRAKALAERACTGTASRGAGPTWSSKCAPFYEERYGKKYIPADMTIQDGDHLRRARAVLRQVRILRRHFQGKAGNLRGVIQPGGSPFEGPRAREYPLRR